MYNIFVSLQRLQVFPCCSLFCFLSQVLVFFPLLSILYASFPGTGFSFMGAGSFTPSDFVEFIFSFIYFLSVILSHFFCCIHSFLFLFIPRVSFPAFFTVWRKLLGFYRNELRSSILTRLSKRIRIIPNCNVFFAIIAPFEKTQM